MRKLSSAIPTVHEPRRTGLREVKPDRPDLLAYGAGGTACKPFIAAVAKATFDAGRRSYPRVPFRDERVLAAVKAAGVECRYGMVTRRA